jgi:4-hydroxy-tetrahydrodipicolinate synthase
MKLPWIKGVMPALVTPFSENFEVDETALRNLIDFVVKNGVTALVPCGSTGEFTSMSIEERKKVISITVNQAEGKARVIAGTGDAGTDTALEMTKYAEKIGVDAVLIVSPFYLRPTDKEIFEHYKKIAESTSLPIILYNIPQLTGVEIPWWVVEGLAGIENIVGINDSSGNMPYLMTLFEKVFDKMSIICGHDEIATAALAAGADGLILASANMIPDVWVRIYNLILDGKTKEAFALQRKIQTLARIITRQGGALAVKAGLNMMGMNVGKTRKPLIMGGLLRYEDEELMRIHLEALDKIPKKVVTFTIKPGIEAKSETHIISQTPNNISDFVLKVGEGFASPSTAEIAHIDLALGMKDGPVGRVFQEVLNNPVPGHKPIIVKFNEKEIKPRTLLIPTVMVRNVRQEKFVYEYAMKGVAKAILDSITDGILPSELLDDLVMVAHVFVHPTASNPKRVEINNYKAMRYAIRKAIEGRPTLDELLERKESARHPFKYTP